MHMGEKRSSRVPSPPSDGGLYRRALLVAGLGVAALGSLALVGGEREPGPLLTLATRPRLAALPKASALQAQLVPLAFSEDLRKKGYHFCNPPDPLGLGPYAPYQRVHVGRMAVPQQGGHDETMGFDVLVHFHGADPIRKTLVQIARGIVFVGVDKGMGSGPYAKAFENQDVWPTLKRSIDKALKRQTGDERAHARHLALSAWSAGYGAVNEILKQDPEGVDAVILLDALHAGWKPGANPRNRNRVSGVDGGYVAPIIEYARAAARGEGIFLLTHSYVDPVKYPSVALTADYLLAQLGVERQPVHEIVGPLTKDRTADRQGLHVWSFRGHDELTHCAHVSLITQAVRDLIEPAWDTPPMNRAVPPTPAPVLGGASDGSRSTLGVVLEPTTDAELDAGSNDDLARFESEDLAAHSSRGERPFEPEPEPKPGSKPESKSGSLRRSSSRPRKPDARLGPTSVGAFFRAAVLIAPTRTPSASGGPRPDCPGKQ